MQSKQYFTKIKNYPHEKSTEPKKEIAWEEVAGVVFYKDYCFLYDKGGEFLLVTSDERVKESLLYYLNARKVK